MEGGAVWKATPRVGACGTVAARTLSPRDYCVQAYMVVARLGVNAMQCNAGVRQWVVHLFENTTINSVVLASCIGSTNVAVRRRPSHFFSPEPYESAARPFTFFRSSSVTLYTDPPS